MKVTIGAKVDKFQKEDHQLIECKNIMVINSKDKVKKVLMNFYLARGTPIAL